MIMANVDNKGGLNIPQCKHFVIRKKRYCKMTVKRGEEYCGEHMLNCQDSTDANTKLRVVCPLDRKHTCYAHNLAKHLKICNARQDKSIPYIVKSINCGEMVKTDNEETTISQPLDSYTVEDIAIVIQKIIKLYDNIKIEIKEKILKHPLLENEISKPELGDRSRKHLYQTSSILGYLKEYNMLQPDTCFIEFGAGKGKLSFWIATALEGVNGSKALLIERASPRHKMDNKFDKSSGNIQRVRADIADLVLNKVDAVQNVKQVVGVTKHLCGDATDLALRCLTTYQDAGNDVSGIVMAFCCHHRCQWKAYTGREYFSDNNVDRKDFDIMKGVVSWSTCGTGFSREKNKNIDDNAYKYSLDTMSERDKKIGLSRHEKEIVGKKCKILLNYGRLKYLEQHGFKSELFYYVNPDVSLENLCIVAFKEK